MAKAARGRVNRIYSNKGGSYIRLTDSSHTLPKDDYFWLPLSHPNYQSVLACCMAGQINKMSVQIRTEADITPAEHADVQYVTLDS